MTHGFDDEGRQFDAHGNLRDWWTPADAKAFDTRGNVFNNNRQYDRAIEDYNEAVRLDPKFAQAFMDRGVAHYFKGEYVGAVKDYDAAIALSLGESRIIAAGSTPSRKPSR